MIHGVAKQTLEDSGNPLSLKKKLEEYLGETTIYTYTVLTIP